MQGAMMCSSMGQCHCQELSAAPGCAAVESIGNAEPVSTPLLQGRELEAEVQESKLYSDRLAALDADLNEARLAEQEASSRHAKHLAELEPLANRHRHHKVGAAHKLANICSLQLLHTLCKQSW
jgi:cytochrome c-type biogenesis protein CcmH/NrfG